MFGAGSKLTSECRLLSADDPEGEPRVVAPRRQGVEYDVEPAGDRLLIVHNDGARDFELAEAPLTPRATPTGAGDPPPAGCPDPRRSRVRAPCRRLAPARRADRRARAPPAAAATSSRRATSSSTSRCTWSMPPGESDYETADDPARLRDRCSPRTRSTTTTWPPPSSPCASAPRCWTTRLRAVPADALRPGARLGQRRGRHPGPLSIVRRADVAAGRVGAGAALRLRLLRDLDGPGFSIPRLSLLDRGIVYRDRPRPRRRRDGPHWYEHGQDAAQDNTFTDFVACADYLVDRRLHQRRTGSRPAAAAPADC